MAVEDDAAALREALDDLLNLLLVCYEEGDLIHDKAQEIKDQLEIEYGA